MKIILYFLNVLISVSMMKGDESNTVIIISLSLIVYLNGEETAKLYIKDIY